jgi:hypothetical protein
MHAQTKTLGWVALFFMFSLSACATYQYSAKPIHARVVDAQTGEPLPGVNVVAVWELEDPIATKGQGNLQLMEAVTDGNGNFQFQAWGPKPIPVTAFPGTRLTNNDPRIILFKSGFTPRAVYNDTHSAILKDPNDAGPVIRDSQWEGKAIGLEKFSGPPSTYAILVSGVLTGVGGGCEWKSMPRMVVTLNRESDRLKREGVVKYSVANPSIQWLTANEAALNCGPTREILKEYSK